MKEVTLYTDGGSLGNPGPGGYGAVLMYKHHRKEVSGAFRKTTNNRMEIMAVIQGLSVLTEPCRVNVFSDSRYVVDTISKGWAVRWRSKNWMRNDKDAAINPDLWDKMLTLCEKHDVTMNWVKGHAGIPENERCDELCGIAANKPDLPPDSVYEQINS